MHCKETTAYVFGWDIRLRLNNALVCFDLESRRFLVFGDAADTLDLKIQAIKLKDWLLDDRQVLEAIMRGDKELRAVVLRLPKAPPRRRLTSRMELRT